MASVDGTKFVDRTAEDTAKDGQELPREWLEREGFYLRVAWLGRQPREDARELQEEFGQDLLEQGEEEKAQGLSLEIDGHPGWWMHFNVENGSHDALEEALAAAKTVLKRSELNAGTFNFSLPLGTKAPTQLSKRQRIGLIDQIMNPPARELPEGLVREAFLELGDHALSVWIERLPYREEFSAPFAAPENPLRSMVGLNCVLSGLGLEDAEREDGWRELARGPLAVEGTTVRLGGWSAEVDGEVEVHGTAFTEASLESEALEMSLFFEVIQEEPS